MEGPRLRAGPGPSEGLPLEGVSRWWDPRSPASRSSRRGFCPSVGARLRAGPWTLGGFPPWEGLSRGGLGLVAVGPWKTCPRGAPPRPSLTPRRGSPWRGGAKDSTCPRGAPPRPSLTPWRGSPWRGGQKEASARHPVSQAAVVTLRFSLPPLRALSLTALARGHTGPLRAPRSRADFLARQISDPLRASQSSATLARGPKSLPAHRRRARRRQRPWAPVGPALARGRLLESSRVHRFPSQGAGGENPPALARGSPFLPGALSGVKVRCKTGLHASARSESSLLRMSPLGEGSVA